MYRFWVEYDDFGHLEKTEKRSEDLGRKLDPDGFEDPDARGFMIEVDESTICLDEAELGANIEREVFITAMAKAYDECQKISHYYSPTSVELISC